MLPGEKKVTINGTELNTKIHVDHPARTGDAGRRGIPSVKGVSLWNGNFHHEVVDMTVPGKGLPFTLSRSYNSYYWAPEAARGRADNFHPWRFNWDLKVGYVGGDPLHLYVTREDGSGETFYKDTDNNWYPIDQGNFDVVKGDLPVAGQTMLATRDGRWYVFENPDLGGRLLAVSDYDGNVLSLTHGGNGKVASVTDAAGRAYTFTYDASALLQRVTDFTGRYVAYTWESDTVTINSVTYPRDRIKTVRDVNGNTTTYNYTAKPATAEIGPRVFLTSIEDARLHTVLTLDHTLGAYGNYGVSSLTDAAGGTWAFSYCAKTIAGACGTTDQAQSFLTTVTAPIAVASFKSHFDTAGRYTGKTVQVAGVDRRTEVIPYPTTGLNTRNYNFAGLVNARKSVLANQTSFTYYASGHANTRTNADTGVQKSTWVAGFAGLHNCWNQTQTESPAGVIRDMTYTNKCKLATSQVAGEPATTNQYHPSGLVSKIIDPLSNATDFAYDSAGNLTTRTDALGNPTQFEYSDSLGRVTRRIDPRGVVTAYTYDNAGQVLTETVDPGAGKLNLVTQYTYDANGNQVTRTDPRGTVTTTTYDNANRPIFVSTPVGTSAVTLSTNYDVLGRVVSVTNANSHTSTTTYDEVGNVASRSDALPRTTTYTYDGDNRVKTETDPEGRVTTYNYDPMGRVVEVITLDGTVRLTYDTDGRLKTRTDRNNQTTAFGYDAAGRRNSVTEPGGAITRMTYDAAGRLTTVSDPRTNQTTYSYDELGRRTRITDPTGRFWQTTYDTAGNAKTTVDPTGKTATYSYDAANRLVGVSWSDGSSVAYTLDKNGNRTAVIDNTGTTNYAYDALNRVTAVTDPNGQSVTYAYDGVGNVTTLGYPGSRQVSYQYDTVDRMWRLTDWGARATTFTLDRSDRVTQIAYASGVKAVMAYDPAGRLESQTTRKPDNSVLASWALVRDGNGNITQATTQLPLQPTLVSSNRTWTYGNDNRQSGNTFDEGGRVTNDGTHTLTWNAREQVVAIDGQAQTYNADGLRVAQQAGGVTTRFVFDRVRSLPNLLVETDTANAAQRYYIHSPYGLVEQVDAAGNPRYYHYDTNGNTVALTDAAGAMTDSYAYLPYGETTVSGSTPNPFRFVGQYGVRNFAGTSLHDMRARWYDADTARFLSIDPLLGDVDRPQSINAFSYAEGNPVVAMDPGGEETIIAKVGDVSFFYDDVSGVTSGVILNSLGKVSSQLFEMSAMQSTWQSIGIDCDSKVSGNLLYFGTTGGGDSNGSCARDLRELGRWAQVAQARLAEEEKAREAAIAYARLKGVAATVESWYRTAVRSRNKALQGAIGSTRAWLDNWRRVRAEKEAIEAARQAYLSDPVNLEAEDINQKAKGLVNVMGWLIEHNPLKVVGELERFAP